MGEPSVRHAVGARALALLDERWDELVGAQPLPNPTNSAAWLRGVARWPGASTPRVILVERDGVLLAGGAFWERPLTSHGGPAVATFLGDRRPGMAPDLIEHPDAPVAGRAVMRRLLKEVPVFRPSALRVAGPAARALADVAPWSRWKDEEIGGFTVLLPHERIGRRRREVRYERRRAEKTGVSIEARVVRGADVAPALDRLLELHRRQWSQRADNSSRFSTTEDDRAWHREQVGALADQGRALIGEVLEDGRLRGSALVLLHGRGAMLHTIALDPSGSLRGAGNAAVLTVVEAATEDGAAAMALGRGAGGHKDRFHPDPDDFARVLAARNPYWQRVVEGVERGLRGADRLRATAGPGVDRIRRSLSPPG